MVQGLLAAANRGENEIDFVEDRAGHDRKYAINPQTALDLGWSPNHPDVKDELGELYAIYSFLAKAELGK